MWYDTYCRMKRLHRTCNIQNSFILLVVNELRHTWADRRRAASLLKSQRADGSLRGWNQKVLSSVKKAKCRA